MTTILNPPRPLEHAHDLDALDNRHDAPPDGRLRRLLRGDPGEPRWARPGLLVLLAATGALYLWGLGAEGWANSFYAAAVEAGTRSWKAFFFGSFDASSFITVDKPPASLWVMELSGRVFGFNAWSMLVPEALEGVATVAVLYATVRRWFGSGAALLAGAVVALTPVAALMFRFNNPDALLVLLLTAGAWAVTRAIETGRSRWLWLAMALVGTGFITKMLQAFLVLPAFALAYLLAGPPKVGRRIAQIAGSALALVLASGWWVAAVELTAVSDRPYIGGSQDNNLFNLIFGYNGFGRITGNERGSAASQWGPTGWDRLFLPSFGSQISWLIPGALVLLVAALWASRRGRRTDRTRCAMVIWGGWLVVTGLLLSYAKGIIHPYYTVALSPAIGAVVGIGAVTAWRQRERRGARAVLAVALALTSWWTWVLLGRSATWVPALRIAVLPLGLAAAAALLVAPLGRRVGAVVAGASLVIALSGSAAYALDTAATPHSGSIPSAGPTQQGAGGGPGGFGAGAPGGGFGAPGAGPGSALAGRGALPAASAGGAGGGGGARALGSGAVGGKGGFGGSANGAAVRGVGGLLDASTPSRAITEVLERDASDYRWVLAVVGSNSAAGYQLATDDPVMAIGGFNGTDPAPSLAEFEHDVATGEIHYFIAGGGSGGGPGGSTSSTASAITSWVESHFHTETVDGTTLYVLHES